MPGKNTSALIRKISKPLGWLLCAYLFLFLAVLIPFHQHANDKTADDCQICALAGHSIIANAGPSAAVFFVFFLIAISGSDIVISARRRIAHLRGPPVF